MFRKEIAPASDCPFIPGDDDVSGPRDAPDCLAGAGPAPVIEVRAAGTERRVFALAPIAPGETVLRYDDEIVAAPTRYSIQIDAHRHIGLRRAAGAFTNHACEPNCAVDLRELRLVAIKPIAPGDEITFHYSTTEWELTEPFECHCGAATCVGTVRGFKHLAPAERQALAPYLSPFLRGRLESG